MKKYIYSGPLNLEFDFSVEVLEDFHILSDSLAKVQRLYFALFLFMVSATCWVLSCLITGCSVSSVLRLFQPKRLRQNVEASLGNLIKCARKKVISTKTLKRQAERIFFDHV